MITRGYCALFSALALGCGRPAHVDGTSGSSGDGGTAGAGGAPSGSFETAQPLALDDEPVRATLAGAGARDFYRFEGKKGDRLVIGAAAQALVPESDGYDDAVVDTVVTLLDASRTAIAANDDAWPDAGRDSQLFAALPEDGTYFVTVEDCNGYAASHPDEGIACAPPAGISVFDYAIFAAHTDRSSLPETCASGAPLVYEVPEGEAPGVYGVGLVDGSFASVGETQMFAFTPPADVWIYPGQRARADFFVQPIGAGDGDGSTADVSLWITDAGGVQVIAAADQRDHGDGHDPVSGPLHLSAPVTPGATYYLFVKSDAAVSRPASDVYFIEHFAGTFQLGAQESPGEHGTPALAQPLDATGIGDDVFAVDGDLAAPDEVDWYAIEVAHGAASAHLECQAARAGAGLSGFAAELYSEGGATLLGGGTEGVTRDLIVPSVALPAGTKRILLRVSATSVSATNMGRSYQCFLALGPK